MTSKRKQRKKAARRGLSDRELELSEIMEEMLERLRWQEILSYANQFLMTEKLQLSRQERDRVLEAATRAVDKDAKLHLWRQRLSRIKGEIHRAQAPYGVSTDPKTVAIRPP